MSISKTEAKQLLEGLIFEYTDPQDCVNDIWWLSPMHGDSCAKLLETFYGMIELYREEQLENLLQSIYQEKL